jgi:uncharacterized protein
MLLMGSAAQAQTFPKLTGRVVDQANLLSPGDEAALSAKLAALETQTQRQFVVATVPDLQGYDIADYGYRLGRAWAIGDKARNDGVLMIVAPNDRKVRIENGYGLEGIMTDALSSQIVRRDILPQFKSGNYSAGITSGVDKVIAQLQLPPDQAAKIAAQAGKKRQSKGGGINAGTVMFWLFVFFFFILPALRSMSRGGRQHSRSGYGGPVVLWGGGDSFGSGGSSWGGGGGGFGGGGFGGGGGSFGGGGASGDW